MLVVVRAVIFGYLNCLCPFGCGTAEEESKRTALAELETKHANDVKALREDTWRLQDAMTLLQRCVCVLPSFPVLLLHNFRGHQHTPPARTRRLMVVMAVVAVAVVGARASYQTTS